MERALQKIQGLKGSKEGKRRQNVGKVCTKCLFNIKISVLTEAVQY